MLLEQYSKHSKNQSSAQQQLAAGDNGELQQHFAQI